MNDMLRQDVHSSTPAWVIIWEGVVVLDLHLEVSATGQNKASLYLRPGVSESDVWKPISEFHLMGWSVAEDHKTSPHEYAGNTRHL